MLELNAMMHRKKHWNSLKKMLSLWFKRLETFWNLEEKR
jgi:hypothetical protein